MENEEIAPPLIRIFEDNEPGFFRNILEVSPASLATEESNPDRIRNQIIGLKCCKQNGNCLVKANSLDNAVDIVSEYVHTYICTYSVPMYTYARVI
jgi:hypothetical protein